MLSHLYTVSIAVHNCLAETKRCLESIYKSSPMDRTQVVVFDNASAEPTASYLRDEAQAGRIGLNRYEQNLGFGEAHRKNLEFALGAYFVVLNNDTAVSRGWLEAFRECFLADPKLAICGPATGGCIIKSDGIGCGTAGEPEYIEGSCIAILTWLAQKEGLFSPEYRFAYCEDADLSLRLRRKGWKIKGLPNVEIKHSHGATSQLVRQSKSVDLDGYHAMNHVILRRNWKAYLADRTFSESILIKRRAAIGDVLLLTPILRELKRQNAEAKIMVETICPEVLENNPDVFATTQQEQSPQYFHRTFDLNLCYERQPKRHIITAYAEACGLDPAAIDWRLRYRPDKQGQVEAQRFSDGKKVAVIHSGITDWPGRNWAPEKFQEVANLLAAEGYKVALVGNHATPQLKGATPFIDKRVSEVYSLIEQADVFIGIDSFPMHLAQAALTPTVGIFGMIDPKYRLLPFPFIAAVQAQNVGCLGCHHEQQPPRVSGECFRPTEMCMDQITVDQVMQAVGLVLETAKQYSETGKIKDKVIGYCKGVGIDIGCGKSKIKPDAIGFDDDPWECVGQLGDAAGPLPYRDGQMDYVYSSHCLEDIADTEGTVAEWLRIMRAGGYIILYVPHPELYKGTNLDHKHPGFTPDELTLLLRQLGCKVWEAFEDSGADRYSTCVVAQKPPFSAARGTTN
jgi:ADP-heptose:LPS heptosyltransferase